MQLRPYQTELVQRVRDAWHSGKRAPCIVLPCGGGKSVIVADIAKRTTDGGKHVLFLVHRKELCEQIENTFRAYGVNMDLCDVMMVQTAARRRTKLQPPTLIITDENHHSLASTYRKIYEAFPKAYRVGVTATPVRLDGSGLGDVNDALVEGVSAKWLIANHYLAPYDYYAPNVADLNGIKMHHGDFDTAQTENVLMTAKIYGDVIGYYQKYAENREAICYCISIKHSEEMARRFQAAGIRAAHIDGKMAKQTRAKIVEQFRKGEIKILCNVDLISEGFDVPDCSCAILLRPTQSLTLYIQQSMRAMRYQSGKRAVILDHVGNYARHGLPDDDRKWDLHAKKRKKPAKTGVAKVEIRKCDNCFNVFAPRDENGNLRTECPHCGTPIPTKIRQAQEVSGELQKITAFQLDFTSPHECKTYRELLNYARAHGYKAGWAYYQAKQRGIPLRTEKT